MCVSQCYLTFIRWKRTFFSLGKVLSKLLNQAEKPIRLQCDFEVLKKKFLMVWKFQERFINLYYLKKGYLLYNSFYHIKSIVLGLFVSEKVNIDCNKPRTAIFQGSQTENCQLSVDFKALYLKMNRVGPLLKWGLLNLFY